jgi:dTDP-D-glucose 4,6-dehydratase
VLVSGGAGFIGSVVVRHLLAQPGVSVVNVDKLTYAGISSRCRALRIRRVTHSSKRTTLATGVEKTVRSYLENQGWWQRVSCGAEMTSTFRIPASIKVDSG